MTDEDVPTVSCSFPFSAAGLFSAHFKQKMSAFRSLPWAGGKVGGVGGEAQHRGRVQSFGTNLLRWTTLENFKGDEEENNEEEHNNTRLENLRRRVRHVAWCPLLMEMSDVAERPVCELGPAASRAHYQGAAPIKTCGRAELDCDERPLPPIHWGRGTLDGGGSGNREASWGGRRGHRVRIGTHVQARCPQGWREQHNRLHRWENGGMTPAAQRPTGAVRPCAGRRVSSAGHSARSSFLTTTF